MESKNVNDATTLRRIRLHITGITDALAVDPSDLVSRIARFGTLVQSGASSVLSIHKKPTAEHSFAFMTIETTQQKYGLLRKALNGVRFKGGVIKIEEAKQPDYSERIMLQQASASENGKETEERKRQKDQQRAASQLQRLIFHIRRGHYQFGKQIPGRLRVAARDARAGPQTFRVRFRDGKTRIVVCKKQKLWGVARMVDAKDRVFKFVDADADGVVGRWVNDAGEVLETVIHEHLNIPDFAALKAQFDDYGTDPASTGDFEVACSSKTRPLPSKPPPAEETEEERERRLETAKNLAVLQGLSSLFTDNDTSERNADFREQKYKDGGDDDSDGDSAIFEIINSAKWQVQKTELGDDDNLGDIIVV
ncbi:uncharacterized protein V1518DRAFT_455796 [Limtongia smithiae]|uniref:uncharacterized protein n=1 Tax=Limtongia smithiae TaxID=1125753 RepID=UPI0034CD7994